MLLRILPTYTPREGEERHQVSEAIRSRLLEASTQPTAVPIGTSGSLIIKDAEAWFAGEPLTASAQVAVNTRRAVVLLVFVLVMSRVVSVARAVGGWNSLGILAVTQAAMMGYVKKCM